MKYRISGVWKDSENVITHYAFHTLNENTNTVSRAVKKTKDDAILLVVNPNNEAVTWIWNYNTAKWSLGETVEVINGRSGKYLRSNPDNKLTDNLAHLINFDWIKSLITAD